MISSEKRSPAQTLKLIEEIGTEAPETGPSPGPTPASPQENAIAIDLMFMALKALSQRTLVALASLQTLLAIGSALFLSYAVLLPAPSWPQIVGTALYDGFVLLALWLSRKK